MRWSRNEATENRIATYGVQWRIATITRDQIDERRSFSNQARLMVNNGVIDDVVLEYAIAMEREDSAFEMIIVHECKKGIFVIVDGNHRFRAETMATYPHKPKTLNVYVVTTDDPTRLELMTKTWNYGNGVRPSDTERKQQALQFIASHTGADVATVARHFGVKAMTVMAWVRDLETHKILEAAGVFVPPGVTHRLSSLRTDVDVLKTAAMLARDHDMTIDQAAGLVAAIKSKRTVSQKFAAAREYAHSLGAKSFPSSGRNGSPTKIRDAFRSMVARLIHYLDIHPTYEHLQLTSDSDYNETEFHVSELMKRLARAIQRKKRSAAK